MEGNANFVIQGVSSVKNQKQTVHLASRDMPYTITYALKIAFKAFIWMKRTNTSYVQKIVCSG